MTESNPTRTLVKGAGIAFGGNLLLQAIGFVYHVPVVRLLGPDKYGILGVVNTVTGLVGELALFGIGTGIMYYLSRAYEPFDAEAVKGIVTSAFKIVLTTSCITLILVIAFTIFFAETVYPFPDIRLLLSISSLGILLSSFWNMGQAIFRAVKRAEFVYKPKIAAMALQLLSIPLLIWITNGNLFVVVVGLLFINTIPLYYGLRLFNANILSLKQFLHLPYNSYTGQLLLFSWPLLVSSYVQNIGKKMDVLLIGHFLGEHEVGLYSPALTLSSILWFIPMALTYLLFPIMNSLLDQGKEREFFNISERAFKYVLYTSIPLVCFFLMFSNWIMEMLYGAEFAGGSAALSLLSLARFIQSFYVIPAYIIHSQKRTKTWMWIVVVTMSINVIGVYFLTPRYGIEGPALAILLSYLLTTILATIGGARLIGRFVFPYKTLGAISMGAAAVLASLVYGDRTLFGNIIIYMAFVTGWFIWLMKFERPELNSLKGLLLSQVLRRWEARFA